jgi:hypothetical protein
MQALEDDPKNNGHKKRKGTGYWALYFAGNQAQYG